MSREMAELMEMAEFLTDASNYKETIEIIVSRSADILKSDRACLVVKTKEGKLRIESGIPAVCHGVGTELTPETGELFLRGVLDGKTPVKKNVSDPEVAYMGDFARIYDITSFLAIPLHYEDEPIGILVLDFVHGHEISEDNLSRVRYLANLAAIAIKQELNRQEDKEKMRLVILGENAARISHVIGNKLLIIGGFSQYILEGVSKSLSSGKHDKFDFEEAKDSLERVIAAVKECEAFVKTIKDFSKPKIFNPESVNLNEFLEDKIMTLSKSGLNFIKFRFDLDFDIPTALIDKSFMFDCIQDIIENATQAHAKIVIIKSRFLPENGKILISIVNDGAEIDPLIINKIFDPFMTTKNNGTGIGLANVKTIVEKFHGGKVEVESDDERTEFKIYLPIG